MKRLQRVRILSLVNLQEIRDMIQRFVATAKKKTSVMNLILNKIHTSGFKKLRDRFF